jgi:DNA polymerase sigma
MSFGMNEMVQVPMANVSILTIISQKISLHVDVAISVAKMNGEHAKITQLLVQPLPFVGKSLSL